MSAYTTQAQGKKTLQRIGTWATWWWGLSCVYVLLLVLLGSYNVAVNSFAGWAAGMASAFTETAWMQLLLAIILAGWIIGALWWLDALKRAHISYRVALKDLFLTLRR